VGLISPHGFCRGLLGTRVRPSALCQPLWALMSLSEKWRDHRAGVASGGDDVPDRERPVHTGSDPHRPRWRWAMRRSKLVVIVDELGRVVSVVVSVIEGVRADIDRLWMPLNLIQLLGDRAPHFLRHHGFRSIEDLVDLTPHLGDFVPCSHPAASVAISFMSTPPMPTAPAG
jgi:hypothetical protein